MGMSICTTEWVKGVFLSLLPSPVWFSVGWWWWIWALGCIWEREVLSSFLVAAMDFNQFPHPADFFFQIPSLTANHESGPWPSSWRPWQCPWEELPRRFQCMHWSSLVHLGTNSQQPLLSASSPDSMSSLTDIASFGNTDCWVLSASCSSLCVLCLLPCFPGMD